MRKRICVVDDRSCSWDRLEEEKKQKKNCKIVSIFFLSCIFLCLFPFCKFNHKMRNSSESSGTDVANRANCDTNELILI